MFKYLLPILLFSIIFFSCNQKKTRKNIVEQDTSQQTEFILRNTITELLNKALNSDTTEFFDCIDNDDFKCFCVKSGKIISQTEKNAVVVIYSDNQTYMLKLYSIHNDKWQLTDSINDLEDVIIANLHIIFDDYNFDGQTDIFLQASASNGYSISMGHLIIINKNTQKFELHKEAREFGNMMLDQKTKTIKSEELHYDEKDNRYLIISTHKWQNGMLKTISKTKKYINYYNQ